MHKITIMRPYQKPNIRIFTDDDQLTEIINAFYGPLLALSDEDCGNTIEIRYESDSNILTFEGKAVRINPQDALQAIENIIYESTTVDDKMFAIHGGAVGLNGKAFILVGFTESGKSTLTAYLVYRGFDFITDDVVLLRKSDLKVISYPGTCLLREGGVKVLQQYGMEEANGLFYTYGNIKRRVAFQNTFQKKDYFLEGICFIKRTEKLNKLNLLPKHKAFLSLMENQFIYKRPNADSLRRISLLTQKKVYELQYSDMEFVQNTLRGLSE